MIRLIIFIALVATAYGRRSPHADYVEQELAGRYSDNVIEDALLDVPGLIQKYGYQVEVHSVTTTDGYVLELHRIPHGRDQNNALESKPVVFLMHGLMSSSAEFVVLGPGNALGYLLAEAGYDVWLGNSRGNFYSRKHLFLDPDGGRENLDFWRFSWDEIGNFDLPASIDYVLEVTGQSKLHYMGHSQGCTAFLVLNSLRPEYNEKFISFQALAPAAFFKNNIDPIYATFAPYEAVLESVAFNIGYAEFLGNRELFTWLATNFCPEESLVSVLCTLVLYRGDDMAYYNATMNPVFFGHAPAGSAVRQLTHYGQVINSGQFRRYNHLPIQNINAYGRPTPPSYDLDRITAPTYIHYSLADSQANFTDILYLAERLPNVVGVHEVARPSFNHLDFVWGIDAKVQVYDKLLAILHTHDNK